MKKLLALVLSTVMALSLTAPALAAAAPDDAPVDGDPGFFTENGLPVPVYNPGDPVPISLNPDEFVPEAVNDTVIGIIGGADGPTSILTTIPGSWANTNPEFEQAYQEMYQAMIDAQKEALGGVAGQTGVMVNGKYIKFSDAAPEVNKDGTMMAPVRALMEALGGKVESDENKIVCTANGVALTFELNSPDVEVEYMNPNGSGEAKTEFVTMPCVPYLKDGRAYVPIRFTAAALGYEVGWDSAYQTVILLNRKALAADIDREFTILNKAQANRGLSIGEGKSSLSDAKCSLTVTIFDTLNGNQTYKADLTGKTLVNGEAINGTYSFTMSDNTVDTLMDLATAAGAGEEDAALVRTMITGLKDMEVIMTREGMVWAHAPILDQLSGKKNVWSSMDMGPELGTLLSAQLSATTMGAVIASMVSTDSVANWVGMSEMMDMMSKIYRDENFTTANGVSTITIGLDELAALYTGMGVDVDEVKDVFKEYEVTMKVDSKGGVTAACAVETVAQNGIPGVKITMDSTQSARKANMTMTVHVANIGELKLTATSTEKASTDAPKTKPPKGATIIDTDAPALLNP